MSQSIPMNTTFNDVLNSLKNNVFSNLNCHNIGKIIEFDYNTSTATIEILQIKQWYGQNFQPAIITDVPVVMFGTMNCRITLPNPIGTTCVLLFMDRNIDNFIKTGVAQLPNTNRMHSMSDCIAIPTISSNIDVTPLYDNSAITISNTETIENEKYTSYIKVKPQSVTIANDKQNLANLMQELLTACENIVCGSYPISSTAKQTFTNLKTKYGELLQ